MMAMDNEKERTNESEHHTHDAMPQQVQESSREVGGRKGLDPVRFGDWELNGKCVDF
jgi:hypothetical protein